MPFVRCKFYTESGDPLRGGCHRKGMGCPFIHPGDSGWTNAPPPSFRAKDKASDSGGFKSWSRRGKYAAAAHSTWDAGGNAVSGTADTGSGWDTGGVWGTGGGLEAGGTPNHVLEPLRPKNPSATKSSNEEGWGGGADRAMGSGWGSSGNGRSGRSSSRENKHTGSEWGSTQNDRWGTGWKDNAGSTSGTTPGDGWGDNDNATKSWGVSDPMIVDSPAEKKTEQNKRKAKPVLAPPRIRIPGNESKKPKITGTNSESLGSTNRWGESRSSNLPTSVTSTFVAVLTPTDSSHIKRKRDAAFDDKSDVFKDYVKAWERGVRARFLLAEAEAKRDRWFRTQKSACYARIGEAGRKRLDGQRAECDREVNSQREKLSCAITSLVGFHDTMSSNLDLSRRYNIGEETKKFIDESKDFVDEVRAILAEHVLEKSGVELGDTQKHPPIAPTSMDSLQSQVQDLEERFEQTQAELTLCHQRDIRSEIDELLTTKIADLRVARQQEIDRVGSQPRPEITIPLAAIKNLEGTAQQVRELDAKVPHTVEDIRVLLLRVDATTKRVSELEGELLINKETYRKQMQEMAADKEETERKVDERLEKVRERYEQLVASQSFGPAAQSGMSPTTYISQHKLMENLRPAFETILDKFYEREVRPTVESLQQIVIEASNCHQEEAIEVLWGRIQPAMNMVAGVSRWLDSQELRFTAPTDDEERPFTT